MLLCLYDLVTAATTKEPAEKKTSQTTNLYIWLKQGIGWQRDWVGQRLSLVPGFLVSIFRRIPRSVWKGEVFEACPPSRQTWIHTQFHAPPPLSLHPSPGSYSCDSCIAQVGSVNFVFTKGVHRGFQHQLLRTSLSRAFKWSPSNFSINSSEWMSCNNDLSHDLANGTCLWETV